MKKNKKLAKTALGGLLAVAVAGATFAWFTDSFEFVNVFETGNYSDEFEETFTPPTDWRPGTTTEKNVTVTNTGDVPMVVRVRFDEHWEANNKDDDLGNMFTYKDDKGEDVTESAAIKNLYDGKYVPNGEEEPLVNHIVNDFETKDSWYVVRNDAGQPIEAYYTSVLTPDDGKNVTVPLLHSVTMNENIPTKNTTKIKFKTADQNDENEWQEVTEDNPLPETGVIAKKYVTESKSGYSNAKYQLNITVETVQADAKAIRESWVTNSLGKNDDNDSLNLEVYIATVLG